VNIKANVLQWDNPDITQIVFDGQYMLGVSAGALEFSKELRNAESEDNVLQVVTDYPQGWKVSKIVDGSDITVTWLSLSNTQGVQGAPVSTQLTMTANTGSTRTAYIHLSAGRLNCTVKVVQTDQAYLPPDDTPGTPGDTPEAGPISITDADGNEVSVLTFAAAALSVPAAQTINISWPEGARLYYTTMNATNPFTFSNRGGNSDPTTGYFLEAGSGPKSYSIRPSAAITTPNLNFDPFYERRCVITYMAVDAENVEVAQTALTIRQEVPNVLASTASSYHAFGSSCTFFVRSNTSWRIERVTLSDPDMLIYDPTDNLAVGATGGFNVAEGSPVTFTLFAKFVFSGSIRVDIASPDSPPAFPTTTVILDVSNNGFIPSMHKGWAGSNIYWDGDLEKLTFDDVGETDHKNYQGVYFQWGSLYGLDASGSSSTSWSTDRIVYKPKTDGSGYEAVTGYSWNSWPQFGNASISANRSRAYLYEITDASTGLGDICKYLSDKGWAPGSPAKKWRLPTANEFEGTYSSSGSYSDVSSSANSAAGTWQNGNAVGRTRNGVFFPAAGYRERSSGTLLDVGDYGSYWTSSPNGTYAYCIDISEAAVEYSNPSYRTFGQSVRCVQE
jgi:uncharacterized protein (TIGR02145 family)